MGESIRSEIAYAHENGKVVRYLCLKEQAFKGGNFDDI